MRELKKILEEMAVDEGYLEDWYINSVDDTDPVWTNKHIEELVGDFVVIPKTEVCKHMNDGWIPVEEEWPPFGQRLQATILHHEWVSDYDSAWVPEEEKIHHPEYTEVCEIYPIGEKWCYNCIEDDYNINIAYIEPAKVLSRPVAEIIAWRPLLEPYRPEGSDNHDREGSNIKN